MAHIVKFETRPRQDLVDLLAEIQKQAENGTLQGAAFVLMYEDNRMTTGWKGIIQNNASTAIGGLAVLQARIVDLLRKNE